MFPPASDWKAMRSSVGDQAGETFVALPLVRARCPVPSAFMT
jgi:hypothetical protein